MENVCKVLIITNCEFSVNAQKLECNDKLCMFLIRLHNAEIDIIRTTIYNNSLKSLQTQIFYFAIIICCVEYISHNALTGV